MQSKVTCPAFYRHFKGGLYYTESIAVNERDGVVLVTYRSLETGDLWVRPEAEFMEEVPNSKENVTGQKHRFEPFNPSKPLFHYPTELLLKELSKRPDCPLSVLKSETDNVLFEEYTVMIDHEGTFSITSGFYSDIAEAFRKRHTVPTKRAIVAKVTYTKVSDEYLTL